MSLESIFNNYNDRVQKEINRIINTKNQEYFIITCYCKTDIEQIIDYLVFKKKEYKIIGNISSYGSGRPPCWEIFNQSIVKEKSSWSIF